MSFAISYNILSSHCHSPSIFPATASTASFNLNDSFTTKSLSSSPHSAMNVAVSATNPIQRFMVSLPVFYASKNIPSSLPPCDLQSASEHDNANIRTRESSERVCIKMSRLTDFTIVSSAMLSNNARMHSCRWALPSTKFNLTETSIWRVTADETCRSLSLRQKPGL